MSIINKQHFDKIWKAHTQFIYHFAWWIVLFFVLLSSIALYYAVNNIGVDSNTADMFDSSLPFRQKKDRFNQMFPLSHHTLVFVVDAQYPEKADSLSLALAHQLVSQPALFENAYVPGGENFFKKNQLLFLKKSELESLSKNLARSHVLFSLLAQNYSLRGLFSFLDQVLSMGNEKQITKLNRLFGEMNRTIKTRLKGGNYTMSWQRVMSSRSEATHQNQRFILVKPHLNYSLLFPAKPAIKSAHKLINKIENTENVSIRITGNVAMEYEELQSVMNGVIIAGILAFILVGITLWFGLRSLRLIFCAILTLLAGLTLTTGFAAVAVGRLNIISVTFAVLYIGLGVDYSIHYALKFNEFILRNFSPFEALRKSFDDLFGALLLSTLSTALGFYAFIPTSFHGVSELGIIAGTGMFISFILTFTFVPALLHLFYKLSAPQTPALTVTAAPFADRISALQTKHASLLRTTGIIAGIVSLILLPKIGFDYNPINLRNPNAESVATMNKLIKSRTFTPWTIEITAPDSTSTKQQARHLRTLKEVGKVVTLFSFVPNHQKEKLSIIGPLQSRYDNIPPITKDSASFIIQNQIEAVKNLKNQIKHYKKPKSDHLQKLQGTLGQFLDTLARANPTGERHLVKQVESGLLKTFPATLRNLKQALKAKRVTSANLPAYLQQRWKSDQGFYRIEVSPTAGYASNNAKRRNFAAKVENYSPAATGGLISTIKSSDAIKSAFIEALIFAFFVIIILLIGYLRSFKYTLYVLLPITLAALMTCAVMVIQNLQFNFANIIAFPLLLGIGVDNGIHIVHRSRNGTISPKNLLKTTTARAIFFSALTTLFSFGNLAFSPHPGTASMGIILALGLLFTLFTTLIILPAFLINNSS